MGREMQHEVEIAADASTVYRNLTTSDGIAGFWTIDRDVPAELGAIARFGFPQAPVDLRMRIDASMPAERVTWHCEGDFPYWAGTMVDWRLAGSGDATRLIFRHSGWPDDYPDAEYDLVDTTWAEIIARLKGFSESGVAQPVYGPAPAA